MCVYFVLGRTGREKKFSGTAYMSLYLLCKDVGFKSYKNRLNFEGVGGQQPRKKAILAIRSLMLIKNV